MTLIGPEPYAGVELIIQSHEPFVRFGLFFHKFLAALSVKVYLLLHSLSKCMLFISVASVSLPGVKKTSSHVLQLWRLHLESILFLIVFKNDLERPILVSCTRESYC